MGVWEQVRELVEAGKGATVRLTEAQEVKLTYHRKKRYDYREDRKRPWETYAGCTDGVRRPRCKRRGCERRLRKDQPIVCSEECGRIMIRDALKVLALLKYQIVERLDDYEERLHGGETLIRALKEE